jgi:hypothetical protein
MNNDAKIFLRCAWIAASVSCFLLPIVLLPVDGDGHWPSKVAGDMTIGMLILSAPASLLVIAAVAIILLMFAPPFYNLPVSLYGLLWFSFFVAGYLQWFHLLPDLANRTKSLTTLGLNTPQPVEKRRRQRRRRQRAPKELGPASFEPTPALQFDSARRSPLEKVISDS